MMDVKHRKAYARFKLDGVAQEIILNDGMSLMQLAAAFVQQCIKAPNRYQGIDFRVEFDPIASTLNQFESDTRLIISGLEGVEMATPEEEAYADMIAANSPFSPTSASHDPLFVEYVRCRSSGYKARKTPEDLALLRKHMETHYSNTQWWDGTHRWMDDNPSG